MVSIIERVARMRQLPARGPVKGRILKRPEMMRLVTAQLRSELPRDVLVASERFLILLDAAPPDFNYERSLLTLMTAQLAGFYEPKDKTLYLAADLERAESDATMWHELVHALQDQHYDLRPRIQYRPDASDEQSAIHALAEGDATSLMLDLQLAPEGSRATDLDDETIAGQSQALLETTDATARVPMVLRRSVVAPYMDGLRFVNWARRRGGWAYVNDVWRAPPTTTEQLLHPEKYLSREQPEPVAIPAAPANGPNEVVYHDILGEQSLRLVFEEWLDTSAAASSASNWAGDRVAVFGRGERMAAAWHIRFDDVASARRAGVAFLNGLVRTKVVPEAPFVRCQDRPRSGPVALGQRERDLIVVLGPAIQRDRELITDGSCGEATVWAQSVLAAAGSTHP